jgi:hypothetical protein
VTSERAQLYRIHGLLVESEIELDARRVAPERPGAAPDYRIVAGAPREAPYEPPPGRLLAALSVEEIGYWATEDPQEPTRWTVRYAGIGEVEIDTKERRITVHRSAAASRGLMSILVSGSALSHALTAEGRLVLHASGVEANGAALAIVGPSGAGKSTVAALLCANGARLVADDALRCEVSQDVPTCFAGAIAMRLRPTVASLSEQIDGEARETEDGRTAVFPAETANHPIELRAAVIPVPSRTTKELEVERLGAMDGLIELLRNPRLGFWLDPRRVAALFEATAKVAALTPVFRATIPWGPPFSATLGRELLRKLDLVTEARPFA